MQTQSVIQWAAGERERLRAHQASLFPVNHIVNDSHASAESMLAITYGGNAVGLPVHFVAEFADGSITALRPSRVGRLYPITPGSPRREND